MEIEDYEKMVGRYRDKFGKRPPFVAPSAKPEYYFVMLEAIESDKPIEEPEEGWVT